MPGCRVGLALRAGRANRLRTARRSVPTNSTDSRTYARSDVLELLTLRLKLTLRFGLRPSAVFPNETSAEHGLILSAPCKPRPERQLLVNGWQPLIASISALDVRTPRHLPLVTPRRSPAKAERSRTLAPLSLPLLTRPEQIHGALGDRALPILATGYWLLATGNWILLLTLYPRHFPLGAQAPSFRTRPLRIITLTLRQNHESLARKDGA